MHPWASAGRLCRGGGGPRAIGATSGGGKAGWEGAAPHFLPFSGMGSVSRGGGGREACHWGSCGFGGPCCLPTEVSGGGVPEPRLSMAARVSRRVGAAGSSFTALPEARACLGAELASLAPLPREKDASMPEPFFLAAPTLLWQEQIPTTVPHLHLLPVESEPPSQAPCACMPGARGTVHPLRAASTSAAVLAELLCQLGKTL